MTAVAREARPLDPFRRGDCFDPATVHWVLDVVDLPPLLAAIGEAVEVVIDLETTGLNEYQRATREWPADARIVLASLTLPTELLPTEEPPTYVVALSHPQSPMRGIWRNVLAQIVSAIARSEAPITNQNLGFDLRWLYGALGSRPEVDLTRQWSWDQMSGSHLLDENASTKLKIRAPYVFDVERWDDFDLSTPAAAEKVPLIDLGLYAGRDTYWTWRLGVVQRIQLNVAPYDDNDAAAESAATGEVEDLALGSLAAWCATPMGASLTRVSMTGFRLDRDYVATRLRELGEQYEAEHVELVDRYLLDESVRGSEPSWAPTSKWFLAWTDAAVASDDLRVTSMTQGGRAQWNKAVLLRQAVAGSEVAERLLRLRKASKRAEFLNAWLDVVAPDGAIHATYHHARVVTGRLSCSDPNLQQVEKDLKPAFVPRPGYLIADLDYSQIELRVAAYVSRCETMLDAYRRGEDLHRLTASKVARVDLAEVTKEQRQHAKPVNFGFLYGMGPDGFRDYALVNYDVNFSEPESVALRQGFFDGYPELVAWHARMKRIAHEHGQVVSPIGRVRRLPLIDSPIDYHRSSAERQAINSPVQGFGSDLMQIAAASIQGYLPGYAPVPEVSIVATIHDSIVVEVPEDDWRRATARCMRRMLELDPVLRRLGCVLDVPLGVEASVGTRWGLADVGVIAS